MLKIGIDDAGRGPVIGPMVLAGCLIDDDAEKYFKKIGVKDSKELTQKRREFLEQKIIERVKFFEIVIINPPEIDGKNEDGINLNSVEGLASAEIINKLNKTDEKIKVLIDCPSTTISKWCDYVKSKVKILSNLEILCEHKADQNHISVSAASILAKCAREREMDKLKKIYGEEIGTGYPSDPLTCRFLEQHALKHKDSGIFRKTWSTWRKACSNLKQKKLFES
jgi:ribonuclease HII